MSKLFHNHVYDTKRQHQPTQKYPKGFTEDGTANVFLTIHGQMHIQQLKRTDLSTGRSEVLTDTLNFIRHENGSEDLHWYNEKGDSYFLVRQPSNNQNRFHFKGQGKLTRLDGQTHSIEWIGQKVCGSLDVVGFTIVDGKQTTFAQYIYNGTHDQHCNISDILIPNCPGFKKF